jgi:hypothetical protein
MGKASSGKKVARAASIGGSRVYRRHTPWGYFGAIALIVILGVVGTVTSRDRRISQINGAGDTAPTVGTIWHEGYAVFACGTQLEPAPKGSDPVKVPSPHGQGIETQASGVILIDPASKSVAGKNATLGKFAADINMKLNAAELQLPGGKLYQDGDSCAGKPGHVYVREFSDPTDHVGLLYNGTQGQLPKLDPRNVPLKDNALLVIEFSSDPKTVLQPPGSVYNAVAGYEAAENSSSSSSTPSSTP